MAVSTVFRSLYFSTTSGAMIHMQLALGITRYGQKAVKGKFDILGHQLTPVDGRLIMPLDTLAEMEDRGRFVRRFPAFGQIGLDDEGTRRHVRADFMPQELVIDEAQRGIRLEVARDMRIKVRRIPAAHAQDAATLGWSRFRTPERGGTTQGQDRQRRASRQASLQKSTTAYTVGLLSMHLPWFHASPSLAHTRSRSLLLSLQPQRGGATAVVKA